MIFTLIKKSIVYFVNLAVKIKMHLDAPRAAGIDR